MHFSIHKFDLDKKIFSSELFFDEWAEEKIRFGKGEILSRPLDDLLDLMAREPINKDSFLKQSLKEMDDVLIERCRSLEVVKLRDVIGAGSG